MTSSLEAMRFSRSGATFRDKYSSNLASQSTIMASASVRAGTFGGPKKIEYFFDLISPYTYFGYEMLLRYKPIWKFDFVLKPFLMGGIIKGSHNAPLVTVPNKLKYMASDLQRVAKYYNFPLADANVVVSKAFAAGTLQTQRFLTSVSLHKHDLLEAVSTEMFRLLWAKGEDIYEDTVYPKVLQNLNFSEADAKKVLDNISSPETKSQLKKVTDEALDHGAFGSPTIIIRIGNETHMVFGSDRFPVIADILGEKWFGPNPQKSSL